MLSGAGVTSLERLSFFSADLMADAGWAHAVEGCDYVLHVASPFPGQQPKDENELIVPARDGAMPGLPDVYFGVVDVRDAANLHIHAMTHPAAKGERVLAVSGPALSMADVAAILHRRKRRSRFHQR
ncbi:hypothetical protein [Ancylobacter pratisalsi]|uniref:NAD-dependent epimerase/dehydratase family protein n=1 Tax=Ancylobacter pratisalsi TaxID=1745854 RepID=A0A6P1YLX0_9HYPH|nr:hypothetical protein [Ancylobacter pratisalsi]QIB33681.1 hypothetical protein G3A50_08185 [Ancylobacter pratisalsi]